MLIGLVKACVVASWAALNGSLAWLFDTFFLLLVCGFLLLVKNSYGQN